MLGNDDASFGESRNQPHSRDCVVVRGTTHRIGVGLLAQRLRISDVGGNSLKGVRVTSAKLPDATRQQG